MSEAMHKTFLSAIDQRKIVAIKFDSKEKGIITRLCIPFDFGPSNRKLEPNPHRYHFYDLDSPEGKHNLSILPEQLLEITLTEKSFLPEDYVTWNPPYKWHIERNWGKYS